MAVIVTGTAYGFVASGNCTAACLIARSEPATCDCRCEGNFHGALTSSTVISASGRSQPVEPKLCGAIPPALSSPTSEMTPCDLPAGHAPVPPLPARYEHHNGGSYGPRFWFEPVAAPQSTVRLRDLGNDLVCAANEVVRCIPDGVNREGRALKDQLHEAVIAIWGFVEANDP